MSVYLYHNTDPSNTLVEISALEYIKIVNESGIKWNFESYSSALYDQAKSFSIIDKVLSKHHPHAYDHSSFRRMNEWACGWVLPDYFEVEDDLHT